MSHMVIKFFKDEDSAEREKIELSRRGALKNLKVASYDEVSVEDLTGQRDPIKYLNVWTLTGDR